MNELSAEDAKLVTLARAAKSRAYAPHTGKAEGAAVRDTDGRTYAAATFEVSTGLHTLPALQVAVAAAASSGVRGLEAAVLVTESEELSADDLAVVREMGAVAVVYLVAPDGTVRRRTGPATA